MALIGFLIFGLVVGLIARLILPGRDPMGLLATMALGCLGSLAGGLLARALFNDDAVGWFGSIVGAVLLLLPYRAVTKDRGGVRV